MAGNSIRRTCAYLPGKDLTIKSFTCHPNPFTARRQNDGSIQKIRFAFLLTDIANSVTLSIFTVSGKKIKTWSLSELVGYQQIEWDGRDHEGYRLANGTYYAKLIVKNDRKKEKKIIRIAKLEGF
jgi:flagellar hook assembly protein FlgD